MAVAGPTTAVVAVAGPIIAAVTVAGPIIAAGTVAGPAVVTVAGALDFSAAATYAHQQDPHGT